MLAKRRVLVTGGAGVIGRELLARLVERRAVVLSVDRQPLPESSRVGVGHIRADLGTDPLDEVRRFDPQIILHLAAAFERSRESAVFREANWHDNTLVSHRIAEMAGELGGLETIVFASSYLLYEPAQYLFPRPRGEAVRLRETDRLHPRNLCGAAKLYAETELDFIGREVRPSLRVAHARIFRVYGLGSRDVISRWTRAALGGDALEIYNDEGRYDFVWAGDVAEGLLRIAECPEARGPVNLGSGHPRSVREILEIVLRHVPEARSRVRPVQVHEDFEASCADLSLLEKLSGWTPPTSVEEGIARIVEYERKRVTV